MNPARGREDDRKYSAFFVIIVAVFITCLITANVIAVKLVDVFGMIMPAAVLIFPVSYIAGDVLTEVYGYHQARRVIWLGFFCNAIVVGAVLLSQVMPPASFWDGQDAYQRILGQTPRILLASFVAYLIGEFANSIVLAKMKIATGGRWLWMRTIGSTMIGQGLDSLVFILIAFSGTIPAGALAAAVFTQWIAKTCYEVIATPLTYGVVGFLKKRERVDVFDRHTRFNPLLIS
ncbi:MAG: transporter [Deltaproteobacteria bacterium HGW-Deltaproteobacteria-21]|nr:MAG: transporter [Deltaproteobacteria bacterium HGW-Deltaproteobacteria-21]